MALDAESAYEQLKEFALSVLHKNLPSEDGAALDAIMEKLETRSLKAGEGEVLANYVTSKIKLNHDSRLEKANKTLATLQSPPFYFFFGLILIALAFYSSEQDLNSSLTFLIAMLGVAILLYGTGSQAAGTFGAQTQRAENLLRTSMQAPQVPGAAAPPDPVDPATTANAQLPSTSGLANVAIAGGAAVLTAFFGWGVLFKAGDIRQVFRDYDQYKTITVEFCDGAKEKCARKNMPYVADQSNEVRAELLSEIQQNLQLRTGLGVKAYSRITGRGLEFIVFNRDLGQQQQLRLEGDIVDKAGAEYSVEHRFFTMTKQNNEQCLIESATGAVCNLAVMAKDGTEEVPRMELLVVVNQKSLGTTLTTENSSTIPAVTPVIPQ